MAYLREKRSDLHRRLASISLLRTASYRSLESYVEWVTLGPGLVEGNWLTTGDESYGQVKAEAQRLLERHPTRSLRAWETFAPVLRQLFATRRRVEYRRRYPYLGPRFVSRAVALSEKIKRGEGESLVLTSYFMGVLNAKNAWDPPECTSSAANILRRGARALYGNMLYDNIVISTEIADLHPASGLIQSWIRQEGALRRELLANRRR